MGCIQTILGIFVIFEFFDLLGTIFGLFLTVFDYFWSKTVKNSPKSAFLSDFWSQNVVLDDIPPKFGQKRLKMTKYDTK